MEHTVEIQKIINKGLGLGYLPDGMVAMISFVVPGETVRIKAVKRTKKYLLAEPLKILDSSPLRTTPPCPYYYQCGGCNIQHIKYNYQLEIKKNLLAESLTRNKISLSSPNIPPAVASPQTFGYRYKIRLHINWHGKLGFHAAKSNNFITVKQCLLATDKINLALQQLLEHGLDPKISESCKSLEIIQCPETGRITFVFIPRKKKIIPQLPAFLERIADQVEIKDRQAITENNSAAICSRLSQHFNTAQYSYDVHWDSHCFFQVNAEQNRNLVSLVIKELQHRPAELLDLYCGTGNFSLPAVMAGHEVTGVEHNQRSIYWANRNCAAETPQKKATFLSISAAEAVTHFMHEKKQFHTVILDPPRQGLDEAAAHAIPDLSPQKIIYVSCDPATLARDVHRFSDRGYVVKKALAIDMFPQTHHIESLVVLEKN